MNDPDLDIGCAVIQILLCRIAASKIDGEKTVVFPISELPQSALLSFAKTVDFLSQTCGFSNNILGILKNRIDVEVPGGKEIVEKWELLKHDHKSHAELMMKLSSFSNEIWVTKHE